MQISNNTNVNVNETPAAPVPASAAPSDPARTIEEEKEAFNKDREIIKNLSDPVEIGASRDSMSLLYKAAIEGINQVLKPHLGDNAIQKGLEQGIDVSPEATAERIVNIATSFYAAYKEQHIGEDEKQLLQGFMETISSGINQGFAESRTILEGLGVLEGSIAENIDTTYDLVFKGLENFRAKMDGSDTSSDGRLTMESIDSHNQTASLSVTAPTIENPSAEPKNIDVII